MYNQCYHHNQRYRWDEGMCCAVEVQIVLGIGDPKANACSENAYNHAGEESV